MHRGLVLLFVLIVSGCAGRKVSLPIPSEEIEGRLVESIVLVDRSVVVFDEWDPASAGQDKRARVQGDHIEGYVDGAYRQVHLGQIQEITLGTDDSKRTGIAVSAMVIATTVGVLVALVFLSLSQFSID